MVAPGLSRQPGTEPSLFEQYKQLAILETETTKTRLTTFTAVLSVSFVLPGLALRPEVGSAVISLPWLPVIPLPKAVFLLGFFFYLFALYHYAWHHRYSHRYRKELKSLEEKLGIQIYRLRVRPKVGRFKLHFDWALYMIGIVYGGITAAYVGLRLMAVALGIVVGVYLLLFLLSAFQADEPLEQ
jgi:hypothetical protein